MDILDRALAQRIGGADGELVEALCEEIVRLRAVPTREAVVQEGYRAGKLETVAHWARNNLRILAEMSADNGLPPWYVAEVMRIHEGLLPPASPELPAIPD